MTPTARPTSSGTEGNFGSSRGTLDPKGRYLAFGSHASNLVADDTNATDDVFTLPWR